MSKNDAGWCVHCHEEPITVTCDDGKGRCRPCATEADFCWCCGREGGLVFAGDEGTLPDGWSGACSVCIRAWADTLATERHHSHLWDVGR